MRFLYLLPAIALFFFVSCDEDANLLVDEVPTPSEPVIVDVDVTPSFSIKSARSDVARQSAGTAWEQTPGNYIISSDIILCRPDGQTQIPIESDTFLYINFSLDERGDPVFDYDSSPLVAQFNQTNGIDIGGDPIARDGDFCSNGPFTFTADFSTPGFITGELSVRLYNSRTLASLPRGGGCDDYPTADLGQFTITYNVPIEDPCE
ncbi:hypothetical protein [Neolewinella antarctica]|uniref:Lipoprotein n=1 Tax=Neolewinella antarctica TaxID=442734 RepID=A0ABX0XGY8_9BACT|nr:hypothetical protein [Neolewinella antarctica]NJC28174.1 hypothetical protein [Neolewinella antarctica]